MNFLIFQENNFSNKIRNKTFLEVLFLNFFYLFLFTFLILLIPVISFGIENEKKELVCKDYSEEELTTEEFDLVIKICDEEIKQDQNDLKEKQKEKTGVSQEIKSLDKKIKISQSFINSKIAKANKLKKSISANKRDIEELKSDLKDALKSLENFIQLKHQAENYTKIETILSHGTISDFFSDLESMEILKKSISEEVGQIKKEKQSLEDLSSELAERESAERTLAIEKTTEREKIKRNKSYKNNLLGILKKEEGLVKEKIKNSEEIKQRILSRKHKLASGVEISFGDALNLIQPYQSRFKMDSAFVLAILFQESGWGGNIGGNIGQCTFNQSNKGGHTKGGFTVMRNTQKDNFLKIMSGLGIDPNTQKISCPIWKDGSYGGAMGPAQFMPNTWMGIREDAAKILGERAENLSPFVNRDAFMSSAAYLKRQYNSKSCTNYANKFAHIRPKKELRERCAAARYYAGGNWWKHRIGRGSYGESVLKRANRFREDIRILNQ